MIGETSHLRHSRRSVMLQARRIGDSDPGGAVVGKHQVHSLGLMDQTGIHVGVGDFATPGRGSRVHVARTAKA